MFRGGMRLAIIVSQPDLARGQRTRQIGLFFAR